MRETREAIVAHEEPKSDLANGKRGIREAPWRGVMDHVEQGMVGLADLMDRYAKEIRTVTEEVLGGAQKPSSDELRRKVTEAQDRIYREALAMYGNLERELEDKLNQIKEMKERVLLLKEVINWAVGIAKPPVRDATMELLKERFKRDI